MLTKLCYHVFNLKCLKALMQEFSCCCRFEINPHLTLPTYHDAMKYGGTPEKGLSGSVERGFPGNSELQ